MFAELPDLVNGLCLLSLNRHGFGRLGGTRRLFSSASYYYLQIWTNDFHA
jgi:hypothetical protein